MSKYLGIYLLKLTNKSSWFISYFIQKPFPKMFFEKIFHVKSCILNLTDYCVVIGQFTFLSYKQIFIFWSWKVRKLPFWFWNKDCFSFSTFTYIFSINNFDRKKCSFKLKAFRFFKSCKKGFKNLRIICLRKAICTNQKYKNIFSHFL